MSKNEVTPVDAEDVYTLLLEVKELLIEQKETLDQLREVLGKVPEAMEALSGNPMFKPFAKMLGLNN